MIFIGEEEARLLPGSLNMKMITELKNGWHIRQMSPAEHLTSTEIQRFTDDGEADGLDWIAAIMPAQVHEILLHESMIEDPASLGAPAKCLWVAERDWIYRCRFSSSDALADLDLQSGDENNHAPDRKVYLNFQGLDTLVDIYLNGRHLAYHNDMYVPIRVDVTKDLGELNTLILHFHSPYTFMKNSRMPEDWHGRVRVNRLIRKDEMDFSDYLGAKPCLTRVGIYDKVTLEYVDDLEMLEADVVACLSNGYTQGIIDLSLKGQGKLPGKLPAGLPGNLQGDLSGRVVQVVVEDPEQIVVAQDLGHIMVDGDDRWSHSCRLVVDQPQLWWPCGYGKQPLYHVSIQLLADGQVIDRLDRSIGFREIKMLKPFDFVINRKSIKLWGAQPAQVTGLTHRWDPAKSCRILDLVENCNMNAQRIWGGSDRYGDDFYDETDRRGILVWQEFFHDYGMYPDLPDYRLQCKKEAEYQVKRLKHHPSLLMWCGGNESIMGAEFSYPGESCVGKEIFTDDYAEVCQRLDPDRYYHVSSPYGGAFANDPLVGDTHSYTNTWYVPGSDYPVMVAEEIRTSPPAVRSLIRYLGEKAWPQDYTGLITRQNPWPWPETWNERTSTEAWKKIPPIEQFYDSDTLESAVYKFGAAHALYMRRILESNRRGKPSEQPEGERICKGHFVCRWNDSWPIIYGSMLDYYLEPFMPYYAIKRAYEPVLLTFDIQDFIYLWLVNDSPQMVEGRVTVQLFSPGRNQVIKELQRDVCVEPGESRLVTDLNEFGQFLRENVLYATLTALDGRLIARTNDVADIEKHLRFPDAKVDLQLLEGESVLRLTTDQFAKAIELTGNDAGDEFGWIFEDNYFDLLPGEVKQVRIMGRHRQGTITAKPYYASESSSVQLTEP